MINNIISPILGAIIGYFTNWLAIKMLFLPYEPKYIGKFKVPFTPGIIPKERERLAKKISMVTEEKVLNKETIKENLFSKENKEKIYLLLERNFNSLKEKDYTVDDILNSLYGDNKINVLNNIEQVILYNIKEFLVSQKNHQNFSNIIVQKIYSYVDDTDKNKHIKEKILQFIINIINNDDFKTNICNMKMCDIIDNESISDIKIAIFENIPRICNFIADKIETDNQLNDKLSIFVKNMIEENVGSFAGLFLNTDKIYNNIREKIVLYLKNKDNQNIIGIKIFEFISLYQDKKIIEIWHKIPDKTKSIMKEKFNDENIRLYINKTKLLDNISNILFDDSLKLKDNINKIVEDLVKNKISKSVYIYIENYIKNNSNKILGININCILDKIDISSFKDKIFNLIEKFIYKEGDKILSCISVSKMVEDKINSFDMATIENLIVSVTKKELNAITIIGGVLGFIIGLIPVILK